MAEEVKGAKYSAECTEHVRYPVVCLAVQLSVVNRSHSQFSPTFEPVQ
jgi:hypothetical protein